MFAQIHQFENFQIFTFMGLVIRSKLDIWLESWKFPSGSYSPSLHPQNPLSQIFHNILNFAQTLRQFKGESVL